MARALICTACLVVLGCGAVAAAPGTLAAPVQVSFTCTSGRNVSGQLAAWDEQGFEGSFGRFAWSDLAADQAWHLCAQTIDPGTAGDWMSLGRLMAGMNAGRARAELAFRWARWLDPGLAGEIARILPPPGPGAEEAGKDEAGPLSRCLGPSRPQPWPELGELERARALDTLKSESAAVLHAMGGQHRLLESPFFLLYTDLPLPEAQAWLQRLDVVYRSLLLTFKLPEDHNLFWGKGVVFMSSRREQFVELERVGFRAWVPEGMEGTTHSIGPKEIANFWRMPDDRKLGATVAHEATHTFLHRYRSDASLPLWIDEGFADYAAQKLVPDSPIDEHRRSRGVEFVRAGGPVDNILDMECIHDAWPGPRSCGQAVSYLLVEMLFEGNAETFGRWIDAMKDGADWESALADVYGLTRPQLVAAFTAGYGQPR